MKDSLEETIKPLWFFCHIFGLSDTWKFGNSRSVCMRVYGYVYTFLVFCYAIVLCSLTFFIKFVFKKSYVIKDIADVLSSSSNSLSMFIDVILNFIYKKKINDVVYEMIRIDDCFGKLGYWQSYKSVKMFIFFELLFAVLIWIEFFVQYTLTLCRVDFAVCSRKWLFYYMSTKVTHVHTLQFSTLVLLVCRQYSLLTAAFRQTLTTKSPDERLSQLKDIYKNLNGITRKINEAYSFSLAIKFCNEFIVIFNSLYSSIFGYKYWSYYIVPTTLQELMLPIIMLMVPTVKLLTVVVTCELLSSRIKDLIKVCYETRLSRKFKKQVKYICFLTYFKRW